MSSNAVLSLNLCYEDWSKTRLVNGKAPHGFQPFEYFCAEQFLKRFLLNDDEIVSGMVGDQHDGGVDAFYFFVNRVLADDNTIVDRRSENDVDVIIMQIKENRGFSPTAIEKLERFTDDLFDLQRTPGTSRYTYHARLARLMRTFKQKMKSMGKANLRVEYFYITRCVEPPDENAERAARTVKGRALSHFPHADVRQFNFVGAQRLYDQTNVRPPSRKSLTFVKSFDSPEGWVGLVPLRTFYDFLKDPDAGNQLNESIFDDNVRGYYLNTAVNRAITTTLANRLNEPEFWMLNNGITILTPYASLNSGVLEIKDPQIVNGLQTSRRIFDYFSGETATPLEDSRRILIRVIQNEDPEIRDEIIRATNNQNKMPPEALMSTNKLHKQLDTYFERNGLFYDRRKGHYKDQGKPISQIVSILTLVQAVVAILIKKPNDARGRPRDYVTKEKKRWLIFGADDYNQPGQGALLDEHKPYDLPVYLQCVKILRRIDKFLEKSSLKLDNSTQRNLKFYLARFASAFLTKNAYCPAGDLNKADIGRLTDDELLKMFRLVHKIYLANGEDDDAAKGTGMSASLDNVLVTTYSPPNRIVALPRQSKRAGA